MTTTTKTAKPVAEQDRVAAEAASNDPINTPVAELTPTQLLAGARTAAIAALLEKHRSDFNELMEAEAKKRGVTWKRKPTPEEKREAALRALLAEDPGLLDRVRPDGDPA
jgi:hypothetical protein